MHLILVLTVVRITGCQVCGTVQLRGSACSSLVFCITRGLASVFLVLHIALRHADDVRTFLAMKMGPPDLEIWKLILVKLAETYITSTRRCCGLGFVWVMNGGKSK